jgi:hypothetical protein
MRSQLLREIDGIKFGTFYLHDFFILVRDFSGRRGPYLVPLGRARQ